MNQLTQTFKILSDETRLRIIMLLYQEDLCVCEICGILDIPQPRISKNLSKLRDLNIVSDKRKEKFVFYSINKNNAIINHILSHVSDTITLYPMLLDDKKRLASKENYLDSCSLNSLNKII